MKCVVCLKKPSILVCTMCKKNVCSYCVDLQTHSCEGIGLKNQVHKEALTKHLVKVVAPKVVQI